MTIASEISRLQTAKADIKSSIEGKGVTVPSDAKLDSYSGYVDQIDGCNGPYSIQDYSAMQGPCSNGFHIPSYNEWTSVKNIWTSLGGGSSDGANFGIALKLPFAGYRKNSNALVTEQGTSGRYRSCKTTNGETVNHLGITSSGIRPTNSYETPNASSIRAFKDTPVIPTSSWTKMYGTSIEAGGIFWSATDGLISLSSNGSTWVTIQDKNLGATSVWNSGDTLSETNCGKYYQYGNNYGFSRTGNITTSTTLVDASNYGPGNYYSSSTFIILGGSPWAWDTSKNKNIRGRETGVKTKGQYVIADDKKYIDIPQTFTVSWTETKDGTTTNDSLVYSDDAASLTAGSTEFDKFFGYSLVRLNSDGEETTEVTQLQSGGYGNLDVGKFSSITSGNNIMVKFPCRGIKMSKSGNVVTLSITSQKDKPGYQYYAFTRGTNIKDNLYLGAYKSSDISNVFKSLSGQSLASDTFSNSRTKSRANNSTISDGSNGWDMMSLYQFMYLRALYTMKYGRPMYNTIISAGKAGSYTTGDSNSIISATGATSTDSSGNTKLFGLENLSHGPKQFIDGLHYYDVNGLTYISTNNILTNAIGEGCFNETITLPQGLGNYGGYISEVFGTNKGMFLRSVSTNSTSTSSYGNIGANIPGTISTAYNSYVGVVGGETGRGDTWASIFSLKCSYTGGTSGASKYTSRLMFL